ncbi:M48 family metallopeptidase [Oscillatoria sp. CS-180]|uniref:M48 family metallopeptidase n=1 Tax=Oscillatoria sp. CS-180 TaxID=3021720 RepID=UPI0023308D16|nr:M48 family metallopeptidase [Oscillatoria sp. CS-180]MDB9524429.1 M48 family metallopeptidase [Oscillatoria sp. CS-180]
MNFFEHQDQARRNTGRLIALFVLAIFAMIIAFYLIAVFGLQEYSDGQFRLWQPALFGLVSVGTLGIISFGSLRKMVELRRGGPAVAESLGGKQVNPQTSDFREKQLLNVVAEMAIASGTPIPTVYLLERETGINAFAAGYVPDDAVIGVTQGCLEQLSREELQGVIAHEFSHILNGDMRLNLKLIGVLQGLLYIYILGRMMLEGSGRSRSSRRDKDGGGKVALIGISMLVVGGIGLVFGRLIKSGVSRQREFLADASSVQFTRNPAALAGALGRIGGFASGSRLRSPKAEEASHMFFGEAVSLSLMSNWMATHPPLKERIRRITGVVMEGAAMPIATGAESMTGAVMGFQANNAPTSPDLEAIAPPLPAPATTSIQASAFVAQIGTASPQQLKKAQTFLQALPTDLKDAVRSQQGAMALVYGLLLDTHPDVRSRQLGLFQTPQTLVPPQSVEHMANLLQALDSRQYLSLLDLSIPALRTITPQQCAQFFKQIQALVRADSKLSLSEYVLQLILQKRLRPHFQKKAEPLKEITSLGPVWSDCQVVLTVLARIGHQQPADALYAFKSGLSHLPEARKREPPHTLFRVSLNDFGQSLRRLEPVIPKLKQSIVDAAAHTVLLDNNVTSKEAELLRAIVIMLDCPIPPFLEPVERPNLTQRSVKAT